MSSSRLLRPLSTPPRIALDPRQRFHRGRLLEFLSCRLLFLRRGRRALLRLLFRCHHAVSSSRDKMSTMSFKREGTPSRAFFPRRRRGQKRRFLSSSSSSSSRSSFSCPSSSESPKLFPAAVEFLVVFSACAWVLYPFFFFQKIPNSKHIQSFLGFRVTMGTGQTHTFERPLVVYPTLPKLDLYRKDTSSHARTLTTFRFARRERPNEDLSSRAFRFSSSRTFHRETNLARGRRYGFYRIHIFFVLSHSRRASIRKEGPETLGKAISLDRRRAWTTKHNSDEKEA